MYCLTRNDMKFGEYFVPARTKAKIINIPKYKEADIPGLHLYITISLTDIALKQRKSVPISEVEIDNELENGYYAKSKMEGITVSTNGTQVFIDAENDFYHNTTLYGFQVKKILGIDDIPEEIERTSHTYGKESYFLQSLIEYLENQFADWVHENCEFYALTEDDIESGEGFDGAEPGDTTLSNKGMQQFESKKLEYQNMLEKVGFTYDFKGGLIWD